MGIQVEAIEPLLSDLLLTEYLIAMRNAVQGLMFTSTYNGILHIKRLLKEVQLYLRFK